MGAPGSAWSIWTCGARVGGRVCVRGGLALGDSPPPDPPPRSGRAEPAALGRALAHMHLATPLDPQAAAGKFGFSCDNTIGGTPQPNGWMDEWIPFFRERRLAHQLRLASNARLSRLAEPVLDNMERFFEGVEEPIRPALIHGDLWSGNIAAVDGEPTVFDPACCFGHSEAEFGMSWCAGFSPAFYSTYHELIPRAEGWDDRHDLYQLYHFLNHFNLCVSWGCAQLVCPPRGGGAPRPSRSPS